MILPCVVEIIMGKCMYISTVRMYIIMYVKCLKCFGLALQSSRILLTIVLRVLASVLLAYHVYWDCDYVSTVFACMDDTL